jgi:hypothetical protein
MGIAVRLAALALTAAIACCAAAAAHPPAAAGRRALVQALRAAQGKVAIGSVAVSSVDPEYASIDWGLSSGGLSARDTSVLERAHGRWRIVWTRESEQPADGACAYLPGAVVRDLFGVGCPAAALLDARAASAAQLGALRAGFLASALTPYATASSGLSHACVSRLSGWAAAVARFASGGSVTVFFREREGWRPVYESLRGDGALPPSRVVLSLASCVGFDPSDYGG